MWEDIITYKYNDFTLTSDDLNIITALVVEFESNIGKLTQEICGAESAVQVPGTELQADSNKWHTTRWQRVTASTCKIVHSYGKRICKSEPLNFQNFLWQKLWSTDNVSSADMLYGIMEEPAARKRYSETTGKINMIRGSHSCWRKKEFNVGSQCFTINGNKLVLKKKHAYYLQIQQQLLVTGAPYCDFVLHTPMGEPSIQRIYIDKQVAADIVILVPEYFLMRVRRNLPPVIML